MSLNANRQAPGCVLRVCVSLLQLGSVLLFYYGYFPVKPSFRSISTAEVAQQQNYCGIKTHHYVDRVAFMLIDALRADFVLEYPGAEPLAKLQYAADKITRNQSFAYVAFAQTPTVTMPRIKAFTSGSVPSFVDVILNFGSTSLQDDNLIQQLVSHGKNVDFYGDDTWLKLFPKTFRRFEGTDSFRVSDYTEVDTNVTRHIDGIFKSRDGVSPPDFLILHYIGLDHIGHLIGPYCHLVPPKLHELSDVSNRLFKHLQALDAVDKKRSLFIIVGDHGMTYDGNHGGNSLAELRTPLILMPTSIHQQQHVKRLAELARYDPLHAVNQVDLVPTLAVLLNLPIPSGNVGRILPNVLRFYMEVLAESENFDVSEQLLSAMCMNAVQLISVAEQQSNFAGNSVLRRTFDGLWLQSRHRYSDIDKFLTDLSFKLTTLVSSYDETKIFIGFAGIVIAAALQIVLLWPVIAQNAEIWLILAACVVHGLTYFASSYVEEEHRLVYFYAACSHMAVLYLAVRSAASHKSGQVFGSSSMRTLLYTIIFVCIARLTQSWNSTGDKWANIPDISDALNDDRGILLVCFIGALVLYQIFASIKLPHFLAAVCIACILKHRSLMGSLLLDNAGEPQTAVVFYSVIIATLAWYALYEKNLRGVLAALIMFNCLVQRPPNVICMLLFIYAAVDVLHAEMPRLLISAGSKQKHIIPIIFYSYLVHASMLYYSLGNSNKLNTVDVASGFTGFPHFQRFINGTLICCYTFSVYAVVLTIGFRHCVELYGKIPTTGPFSGGGWRCLLNILLLQRSISLMFAFAATLNFRYHLFTWSVFAPKLLYEGCFWLVAQVFFWLALGIMKFSVKNDAEKRFSMRSNRKSQPKKLVMSEWWPLENFKRMFLPSEVVPYKKEVTVEDNDSQSGDFRGAFPSTSLI